MNTDIVARGVLAALAIWIPYAAFMRETSLPATWRGAEGLGALPFLIALAVGGAIMFADILLNETSRRKLWRWVMAKRTALYLVVAYLSIITPYSVSRVRFLDHDVVFFYCIIFFGMVGLCWADFKAKRGAR